MFDDDENLKLAIDVNRALYNTDANEIIKTVVRFMEHNKLRSDIGLVQKVPSTVMSSDGERALYPASPR